MPEVLANQLVAAALGAAATTGATTLTLATGDGAKFPLVGTYRVLIRDPGGTNAEIITIASRSGDVLTVLGRGQEGTTAVAHSSGDVVDLIVTAGGLAAAFQPYTKHPYLFFPDGWNDTWIAAKAASGSTPAYWAIIGDSMSDGSRLTGGTGTDIINGAFPGQLQNALAAKYGFYADFWHITSSQDFWTSKTAPTIVVSSPFTNPPWSALSATARTWTGSMALGYVPSWTTITADANLATFTVPAAYGCVQLDLHWLDNAAGTWTYTLDGGGKQTVTNLNNDAVRKISLTGLNPGIQHQVIITDQSGSGTVKPVGMTSYKSATIGVGCVRQAYTTGYMAEWSLTQAEFATVAPNDRPKLWQGAQRIPTTVSAITGNAVTPIQVTTAGAHGLITGDQVSITGALGNTAANGKRYVTVINSTVFTLDGTTGNGTYSGTAVVLKETGYGFPTQPHMAIIALGINDCAAGYGAESYTQTLRRLVHALRRGRKQCSILIVAMHNPVGYSTDINTTFANANQWERWLAAMSEIANVYNCAFLDLTTAWQETPVADGNCTADDPHPTAAGHTAMYNLLAPYVV